MTDALNALTRQYTAEATERRPSAISLEPRAQAVYEGVREICEWRREELDSLPDLISALRTIMKSVRRWSERGGKRGYLDFVKEYLP